MPNRLPTRDPRTVARDIPGLLDIVFPRLSGGLVSTLNRRMFQFNSAEALDESLIAQTRQQKSMLFEIAVAHAEGILSEGNAPELNDSAAVALRRQRRHFDARPPEPLSDTDVQIVGWIATNIVTMLRDFADQRTLQNIYARPVIPGFGWIGSGLADFAIDDVLVEVKNTDRNFVANDYRQILMYWILSYARGVEAGTPVWSKYLLLNSRLNRSVYGSFDQLIQAASGGLGRVEIYEYLRTIVITSAEVSK